jgi:microcompartment protein PduB
MNPEILEKVINGGSQEKITPITEFVGSTVGDTVGLVIANLDSQLRKQIGLDPKYRSVGFVSSRIGGASHIWAADDAVKATNTEIASIQFARDMKGGAGRGATVIFASHDVSDARRAVEVMLNSVENHMGDIFTCDAGHIELHYTARASLALEAAYGASVGKSFGIVIGAPAAVGLVMADTALKTASVDVVSYLDVNSSGYSNQTAVTVIGDSGAVKQSVIAAKEVGLNVLKSMGQKPISLGVPTF